MFVCIVDSVCVYNEEKVELLVLDMFFFYVVLWCYKIRDFDYIINNGGLVVK